MAGGRDDVEEKGKHQKRGVFFLIIVPIREDDWTRPCVLMLRASGTIACNIVKSLPVSYPV